MLALHGLLDADFTLLVPGVVFWLLLGAVDGLTLGKRVSASAGASRARAGLIVAAVALSSVAVSLFTAQQVMREAVILSTKGAWPQSVAGMARASIFDPWSTDIRVQRALILEAAGIYNAAETPGAVARAREQYVTALELQPDGPNNHDTYGLFAMRNGMTDVGIAEFEKALELQPFEALRYARAAEAHFALGYSELTNGHPAEAHPNLERCVRAESTPRQTGGQGPQHCPPGLGPTRRDPNPKSSGRQGSGPSGALPRSPDASGRSPRSSPVRVGPRDQSVGGGAQIRDRPVALAGRGEAGPCEVGRELPQGGQVPQSRARRAAARTRALDWRDGDVTPPGPGVHPDRSADEGKGTFPHGRRQAPPQPSPQPVARTGPHPGPNRPPAGQPGPGPNHPQPGLGPGRRSRRTGGRGPGGAPGSGGGRDPADPGRSSRSRCRSGG